MVASKEHAERSAPTPSPQSSKSDGCDADAALIAIVRLLARQAAREALAQTRQNDLNCVQPGPSPAVRCRDD